MSVDDRSAKPVERAVSADDIAGCLARNTFKDALCIVDRCNMLPDEADLLVLHQSLRFIDVEIKISRADFKADRRKDKWWRQPTGLYGARAVGPPAPLEWPRGVWKHYFALPADVWRDELLEHCSPSSGVLIVRPTKAFGSRQWPRWWRVECVRRAKPCASAAPAAPAVIMKLARLASLRMWDAYESNGDPR